MANSSESVRRAYDTVAETYAAAFPSTEPEQPIDLAMIDHFVGLLGDSPEVLDAGCGTGRMARYLADRGCRVRGVDLSPGMLRIAAREHPDIATVAASITDLPFDEGSFDGILFWYSTIHLPDESLRTWVTEACRVLRPGGLALIAFQTGEGVREVGGKYRELGHDVTIDRHHRMPDDFHRLLELHGFDTVATLDRASAGAEQDGQAVVIARRQP